MDTDTLLKRILTISCQVLHFHYGAIYLNDGDGFFHLAATSGVEADEEEHLRQHPLPQHIVARIIDERYRISDSYLVPAEASIWCDETFASHFALFQPRMDTTSPLEDRPVTLPEGNEWCAADLMLVPLVGSDRQLLGFLTPDFPLDGQRPTYEQVEQFELFANQAAIAIEGARVSETLHEMVRKVREAEKMKQQFLLTASHELRTPLTAIQGYLELLSEYDETLDKATRQRFIRNARRGCDELVLLLNNVLDATSLEKEKSIFHTGPVCLLQPVQTILEILEPLITREKRAVELQVSDELFVLADDLRLRQILLNVLSNALKYTPPGSPLALSAECVDAEYVGERCLQLQPGQQSIQALSGTFVILVVRDWGPGIPLEEQAMLFSKRMHLEPARKSMQRGAGLGLYLCRQLSEAMSGRIWMESSGIDGEGSRFFLALPQYSA